MPDDPPAASFPPPPLPARGPANAWWVLLALLVGLAAGWFLARRNSTQHAGAAATVRSPLAAGFAAAERRIAPSVVTVEVESPARRRRHALSSSLLLPRLDHSQGSGLIVDPRGYILTNRHVVAHAARIQVEISGDPHVYYARLAGADRATDLALVKIDPPRALPAAPLGNSAALAVGDWVVAIGSPFGLRQSVTAGIVSALDRSLDPRQQFEHFIQTDAPINPGNSGGPLVNLAGQVVGINTAIYTETDGYQGVGFALPSNLVAQVYPQLLRQGSVRRGSIGVYFESALSPAVRRVYHIASGVPLTEVTANGPAAKAGLQAGDVITSLNGRAIGNGDALMNTVEFYPIGHPLRVGYVHDGQTRAVELRVANRDVLYPLAAVGSAPSPSPSPAPPRFAPLPADFGLTLAARPAGKGLRVIAVEPDSFADQIGIAGGDVILQLNRTGVTTRLQFHRLAAALHPGDDVALLLDRRDHGATARWLLGGTLPPPLLLSPARP